MKKQHPLVSIVVVNYNGKKYLKACFDSLMALQYPKSKLEVIMVDNCSVDDSIAFVKKNFPVVKVLKNDVNNYARANNLGIKKAKGEFIAFLNNDVIVDKQWLAELVKIMIKNKQIGIVSGKILLMDNRIQSSGLEEYPNFYWGDRGLKNEDDGCYGKMEEVESVCGAAVLFRRTCLEDIGFFDEDFIMYLEDVDICFRAAKKWKIFYVPQSIAKHEFSGTSSEESVRYFSERNRLFVIAKHFPDKLSDSLYGKGYFTQDNNNICDILPNVLSKLIECHGADYTRRALPEIFENIKKIFILEKSMLINKADNLKNALTQKDLSIAELNKSSEELNRQIGELGQQIQEMTRTLESKDNALTQKDLSIAELNKSSEELNRQIGELGQQIQEMTRTLESKDNLLQEKEGVIVQKDMDLSDIKEELKFIKNDLSKVQRFDLKKEILLIKPQAVCINDAEEAVRIIKKKYPNSRIYPLANLLKHDYDVFSHNNNIEKDFIYYSEKGRSRVNILKLFSKILFKKFDITAVLMSHHEAKYYLGYKKARLISLLSHSKNRCYYYVD